MQLDYSLVQQRLFLGKKGPPARPVENAHGLIPGISIRAPLIGPGASHRPARTRTNTHSSSASLGAAHGRTPHTFHSRLGHWCSCRNVIRSQCRRAWWMKNTRHLVSHAVAVDLPCFWQTIAARLPCSSLMLKKTGDVSWTQPPFWSWSRLLSALPLDTASASGGLVSAAVAMVI